LRASSLPYLIKCPWRAVMLYLDVIQDQSGPAAHTGNLAHAAVEHWHRDAGKDLGAAVAAMRARLSEFPLGDCIDAERHFRDYATDPRNAAAEVVANELPVEVTLKMGRRKPIRIIGKLDQIRRVNGRLRLYDVKTGAVQGWDMLNEYAYQMAAYCVGATAKLGEDVHPGALIRTQGYRRRGVNPAASPDGVFWECPYTLDDCRVLLDAVTVIVEQIRKGNVWQGPGPHCNWCPAKGLEGCLPLMRKMMV
jgi:hypothetical protein